METPIQKAIEICDEELSRLETLSRKSYEKSISNMEVVASIKNKIIELLQDERQMIATIYKSGENCN